MLDVYACFEFNAMDAPILRAIKSPGKAIAWLDENRLERFIVPFAVDLEPPWFPPRDLFEWAEQHNEQTT